MINLQRRFDLSDRVDLRPPLVLAVDDNEDNLQLLSELLVLCQCSVITAANGKTTILKAKNYQPNLILLDMMLPDISGIEVTNCLKLDAQTKKIPIVAVTAMARVEDLDRFVLAGCVECVTKPYNIDDLEAVIRKYILAKKFLP
ncbi:MAG TPA: response regulator [Cyanobacteria bacterium UBA11049]|nr:response regulator [Cyanobacteria bacterium UBA11049]